MGFAGAQPILRNMRTWLLGPALLFSILSWLAVSSNRNNVLHAIGKLGVGTKGYGSVNLLVMIGALVWSVTGAWAIAVMFDVRLSARSALTFLSAILLVVFVTAVAGVIFDYEFSIWPILGLCWEVLEVTVAASIGWLVFIRAGQMRVPVAFVASCIVGFSALSAVAAALLLMCPRVSFRF